MAEIVPVPGFSEPFSSLSHFAGALVFAAFSMPLILRGRGSGSRITSLAVFSAATIMLLTISGLYHLLNPDGSARAVVRRLDHAAIFVLIAASFTPVLMILFRGKSRWITLLIIWSYAVVAIVFKMCYFNEIPKQLGLMLYLLMGWIGLYPGIVICRRYGFHFVKPVLWGGIAYSLGGIMESFHWPVMVPGVVQWHEVFHVAVLIGLGFHWAFAFAIADGQPHLCREGLPT
ncbi:MAG: hemolysin III family protein [Planctomycetales bacterium]|nr:hemolysin III family protein [Planctomycetales bacterium]